MRCFAGIKGDLRERNPPVTPQSRLICTRGGGVGGGGCRSEAVGTSAPVSFRAEAFAAAIGLVYVLGSATLALSREFAGREACLLAKGGHGCHPNGRAVLGACETEQRKTRVDHCRVA
jgi:hypothetical protein